VGEGQEMLREALPPCCALTPALSCTRERNQNGSPHEEITEFVYQISLLTLYRLMDVVMQPAALSPPCVLLAEQCVCDAER
jgi:hypothetical protein